MMTTMMMMMTMIIMMMMMKMVMMMKMMIMMMMLMMTMMMVMMMMMACMCVCACAYAILCRLVHICDHGCKLLAGAVELLVAVAAFLLHGLGPRRLAAFVLVLIQHDDREIAFLVDEVPKSRAEVLCIALS